MTAKNYTPFLRRVISTLVWLILSVIKIVLLLLGLIVVLVLCFFVFRWWVNDGQNDDQSVLILQNYEELRAISESENVRPDGKTLPLSESLSTANYWGTRYLENIPKDLLEEKTLVASSKSGGIDQVHTGLFNLNQKSANALVEQLNIKFSKEKQGGDIIYYIETSQYIENELCLNHTNYDNPHYWLVSAEKKNDFFQFCTQSRDTEKIEWDLIIPKGEAGFSFIGITQYVGTTFFIVSHGSS